MPEPRPDHMTVAFIMERVLEKFPHGIPVLLNPDGSIAGVPLEAIVMEVIDVFVENGVFEIRPVSELN